MQHPALIKINHNSIVVIDRDGFSNDSKLNQTKRRINSETKIGNCWITKGREIENYLSKRTILKWLKSHNFSTKSYRYSENMKLGNSIKRADKNIKVNYDSDKVKYANEIACFIHVKDMQVTDLNLRIKHISKCIEEWNQMKKDV